MIDSTQILSHGAFALWVKVLDSGLREHEVPLGSPAVVNADIPHADDDALAAQRVHMMIERVESTVNTAFRGEAPDDLFLLAAESIEEAILFFRSRELEGKLSLLRPFLFPRMEQILGKVDSEAEAMYPKYAQAAENGNPYKVAVLIATGREAEEVRRAFGEGKKCTSEQYKERCQLFVANKLPE